MTSAEPDLWSGLQVVFESLASTTELPAVWHYAALLSLLHPDNSLVERMRTKWTPDLSSQASTDCDEVLSKFLQLAELPLDVKHALSTVKLEEYALLTYVWRYNSFGHHTDSSALCMYDVTSMMSHSCGATGVWHFGSEDAFCLRARVSLVPGDEISISYLADEDLFKATNVRKEKTQGWLFSCTCVRCEGPSVDFSRGFRCPTCVVGTVFFSPSGAPHACSTCSSALTSELLKHYLELEPMYTERLLSIEKTDQEDVLAVKKEAVNLFSHHWILSALDSMIAESAKTDTSQTHKRLHILINRLQFLKSTFPIANYTTAWLLEEIGDIYSQISLPAVACEYYEDAYWTMRVMCGQDHPFTETIQTKWDDTSATDPS